MSCRRVNMSKDRKAESISPDFNSAQRPDGALGFGRIKADPNSPSRCSTQHQQATKTTMSPTPSRNLFNHRAVHCYDLTVRLKHSSTHEALLPACSRSGSRRDRTSRVSKLLGRPMHLRKRKTMKNSVIVLSRLLYSDKFLR